MKLTYSLILLLILTISTNTQSCANVPNPNDKLHSGSLLLMNSYTPKTSAKQIQIRQHLFNVTIPFAVTQAYQIAASINDFYLTSISTGSFDFSVRSLPYDGSNVAKIALLINEDPSWTKVRVTYMISSRKDMYLGAFIGQSYSHIKNNNNQIKFQNTLPNWLALSNPVTSIALFSGCRVATGDLSLLKISQTNLNSLSGLLSVTVIFNSTASFQYIHISYICFQSAIPLRFYNFDASQGSLAGIQFIGLSSIVNEQLSFSGIGFDGSGYLNCNGNKCPSTCISFQSCQLINGIVSNNNCFLCGPGQVYNGDNCENKVQCGTNQFYNGVDCYCINNYVDVGGVCYPSCGVEAYVDKNGVCQCLPAAAAQNNKKNKNQPKANTNNGNNNKNNKNNTPSTTSTPAPAPNNKNCKKQKICSDNMILVQANCQCAQGYVSLNSTCQSVFNCQNGAKWNGATYSCDCPIGQYMLNSVCNSCPINSAWNGTNCNCLPGFQFMAGICTTCPSNSQWNGISCVCSMGYHIINGVCSICPLNTYWTGFKCVCNNGYHQVNNSCILCPDNSVWLVSACVCLSQYYMVNGVCITCPVYSAWNGTTCVCLSGYFQTSNGCVTCASNSVWNGTNCSCLPGFNIVNGICIKCDQNSQWNGVACVCSPDFFPFNGGCLACPSNSQWNGGACICKQNYYQINGICSTCQANSNWNGTACVCNSTSYLLNGICKECGLNQIYNGTSCICVDNYHLINKVCSQCSVNSVWTGSICACLSGFYPIQVGSCSPCTDNAGWNGSACVCLTGFSQNGDKCTKSCPNNMIEDENHLCICKPGYHYSGVATCSSCPDQSLWNGTACACISGYYQSGNSCLSCFPNSFWNGQKCVCQSGFYLISNICSNCFDRSISNDSTTCFCPTYNTSIFSGACISCPNNQILNGTVCICQPNYYNISGVCLQCSANTTWNGSACIHNCPVKSVWIGSSCICQTGYNLILGLCIPCDPNSSYDPNTKMCYCNAGYYGNYLQCNPCDKSCATCQQPGNNNCLSCPEGIVLQNGVCQLICNSSTFKNLQTGKCQNCPSNCLSCSDSSTCSICALNYSLASQFINSVSTVTCVINTPPPILTAESKLNLTGTVIGNGFVYQGLTLSQLPVNILVQNCSICNNLFLVNIVSPGVTITYTTQYVLNSQYWFIIVFNYGAVGIVPEFNYTVRINPIHSSYFNAADMAQVASNSINPVSYPASNAQVVNKNTGKNQINLSGSTQNKNNLKGTTKTAPNTPTAPATPTVPTAPTTNRLVLSNGQTLPIDSATLDSLFGQ